MVFKPNAWAKRTLMLVRTNYWVLIHREQLRAEQQTWSSYYLLRVLNSKIYRTPPKKFIGRVYDMV